MGSRDALWKPACHLCLQGFRRVSNDWIIRCVLSLGLISLMLLHHPQTENSRDVPVTSLRGGVSVRLAHSPHCQDWFQHGNNSSGFEVGTSAGDGCCLFSEADMQTVTTNTGATSQRTTRIAILPNMHCQFRTARGRVCNYAYTTGPPQTYTLLDRPGRRHF
jgi:hypothetical protein